MNLISDEILSLVLISRLIYCINCVDVEVSNDGPGVLDIPITFKAELVGDLPIEMSQFLYAFEDRVYPRHRQEIVSGRNASFTITYNSDEVSPGNYYMKVQVFSYIWGFKGWVVAQADNKFTLQNGLAGSIGIFQAEVSEKALSNSIVATNRTVNATAMIKDGTHFLKNASISYTWVLDGRTFGPNLSPLLSYNFTTNKTYDIYVVVMVNITEEHKNITKLGQFSRTITAKNEIKQLDVFGNTWLLHGALLQLDVNCTGGSPPFWYCWDIFVEKKDNFTCPTEELIFVNKCSFPILHYFSKNATYFIEIAFYNDISFKTKSIRVNVYDKVRQTQLSFVIIPIVSSILAIIIVVVGIAYHLQQRQRYNITLEVADFDFQRNEDLNEKTFFERLRDSFSNSLRGTLLHPCTRAQDSDDMIDDLIRNEQIASHNNSRHVSPAATNNLSYEVIK